MTLNKIVQVRFFIIPSIIYNTLADMCPSQSAEFTSVKYCCHNHIL